MLVFVLIACQPVNASAPTNQPPISSAVSVVARREYTVEQSLTLNNVGPGAPEKQNLWVALIRDFPPYQEVRSLSVSPDKYTSVTDEYGNRYAEFDFSHQPAGSTITVDIHTRVVVNELAYDLSNCTGELPNEFVLPELHVESANPQIVQLAGSLAARKGTVCDKVRAFYDYVGNTLVYTYNRGDWGAQATLGPMGADCTEYTSLLMALSRAQAIPARYFEGLHYLGDRPEPDAQVEHAWPDVYMPGIGWVGLDPTLGRAPLNRDTYFAHYTPDHIIVTMGRNPSTLRGGNYWTHLYWPGNTTTINVASAEWNIQMDDAKP